MTKEIVLVLRKNTGGKYVCRTATNAPSGYLGCDRYSSCHVHFDGGAKLLGKKITYGLKVPC